MKLTVTLICAVLLCCALPQAAEQTCPAQRSAQDGHNPFEAFHHVIAPAWHQAWPDKDYETLFAAAPKFEEAFAEIAALEPEFKSSVRAEVFANRRTDLKDLIEAYTKAAGQKDEEGVHKILPDLHDAFEQTASATLPVHYPEFEGMVLTVNLIQETHLPKNNREGIVGSTETLEIKIDALTPESLPAELKEHEEAIAAEFEAMSELADQMRSCCDKDDMQGYREHLSALNARIEKFIKAYI